MLIAPMINLALKILCRDSIFEMLGGGNLINAVHTVSTVELENSLTAKTSDQNFKAAAANNGS